MHTHRVSVVLLGAMAGVLLGLLAFSTGKNALRDKALITHNALTQGYWIARSLEIGHRMMAHDHINAMQGIIEDIEQPEDINLPPHILTDVQAIRERYITITPLQYNLTDAVIVKHLYGQEFFKQ